MISSEREILEAARIKKGVVRDWVGFGEVMIMPREFMMR